MNVPQNIIAVIFDFDDTLTDDSTTQLLKAYGIDPIKFWESHKKKIENGWEPCLAYLNQILDNVGKEKPFGKLTNKELQKFGSELDFYPGIPELFEDLKGLMENHPLSRPSTEFYIISGGLLPIIEGTDIADYFSGIWGCEFDINSEGVISSIKRAVTFTEKTRYIFYINKGLGVGGEKDNMEIDSNPYLVNKKVSKGNRRIPLKNMIYIGDGLTDVPCFSLLGKHDGVGYGVSDPGQGNSIRSAYEQLLAPQRVHSLNEPKYRKDDLLGMILRQDVDTKASQLDTHTKSAYSP